MRVVLLTGKGGVGKTTTAAGTAVHAARAGLKTLVLSTDPAHSLGDALGVPLGDEPTEVETGLYGMQVSAQRRFEASWRTVQAYLLEVLDAAGVDPVAAEELTVLPGAEEVLALLEVREQALSGRWDLIVVDCAPTAETLRLLALPEALGWYVERVLPVQRRLVRTLRRPLQRAVGAPLPRDAVFLALARLHGDLAEVRDLLTDPTVSSVRLVLTPEAVVVAEARRTLTALALHGYRVDGVVANRVFPAAGADAWRSSWVQAQAEQLRAVRADVPGLPVWVSAYRGSEPVGADDLAALAADLYGDDDALALPPREELLTVEPEGDGYALLLALPLARRDEVDLARAGDELVVTVGDRRRVLALPSALRRCTVAGAALRDGRLRISFRPDPDLWMQPR